MWTVVIVLPWFLTLIYCYIFCLNILSSIAGFCSSVQTLMSHSVLYWSHCLPAQIVSLMPSSNTFFLTKCHYNSLMPFHENIFNVSIEHISTVTMEVANGSQHRKAWMTSMNLIAFLYVSVIIFASLLSRKYRENNVSLMSSVPGYLFMILWNKVINI